jgi:prepilin-type N-terminal cleavage/methylation domain-containing protein
MNKNNKINYFKLSGFTPHLYIGAGFTLVELMVAMTILGMISYLVVISTVANRASSTIARATIFLNAQARQATSNIRRDLMEAQSSSVIMEEQTGEWFDICSRCNFGQCKTTIFRRIKFKVPLVDSNGNLITTTGGDVAFGANQSQSNFVRYALNGTDLERRIVDSAGNLTGTTRIIAHNVSELKVRYSLNCGCVNPSFRCEDTSCQCNEPPSEGPPYQITLVLSISSYEGIPLRSPITFSSTIVVSPRN